MDGILNVNKPSELSSFDVVRLVRKASGERKVGHTGTLDPSARGVLVLCLGKATKVAGYLLNCDKEYVATIRLGETTDTDDATGRVLSSSPVPPLGRVEIRDICRCFLGEIDQVPPLFSAARLMGERLYKIARRGGRITPRAKRVRIGEIELLDFKPPLLKIRVACSKGTYIRSLARDIGEELGCGAHLLSLVRTRVGDFRLEDAVELSRLGRAESVEQRLLPIEAALQGYPQLVVGEAALGRVARGLGVEKPGAEERADLVEGDILLLKDRQGRACALAKFDGTLVRPFKVFI